MSTKLLVPLCAAALLAACGPRDTPKADSETPATGTPGEAATGVPGDTTTTPGGTAGETTAPPVEPAPAEPPPGETPPSDTQQPTSPSSSGGQ